MAVSLKRRLTIILVGLTLLSWLLSVLVMAVHVRHVIVEQVDRHLQSYADMAQHTMSATLEDPYVRDYFEARAGMVDSDSTYRRVTSFKSREEGNAVNLWYSRGQVLVGENAPVFPKPEAEGVVTSQLADGTEWRILYRYFPGFGVWHAVGVDLQIARQGGIQTFWRGILPLLVVLPVTLIILFFGIRSGLRPLNSLAEQISARKPHALEPFPLADIPLEIQPVVISLNSLLDDLRRALASEQRFASNAAHELQNPLAAILVGIHTSQRQLQAIPEGEHVRTLLQRISVRVTSAADTVKQLLTLARLEPGQEFERQPVDIGHLLIESMAEVGVIAMDRNIELHFTDSSPVWVYGNAEWLKILLRNLLLNAFKYASSPGEVHVSLESHPGFSSLVILNDCEPIPEDEFRLLTEAFYHPVQDHQQLHNQGVGLGLSIVQRITELHGADLLLGSWRDRRGFRAEVRFNNTAFS